MIGKIVSTIALLGLLLVIAFFVVLGGKDEGVIVLLPVVVGLGYATYKIWSE